MKSTPPPTLTKDYAFLSAGPSWTAARGTATSAFLVSDPLKRQTSFLCSSSATSASVLFSPSKASSYYVESLQLRVFLLAIWEVHQTPDRCKHGYVKSMISVCRCRYHLVPGPSLSVLSRRCCLYLKHGSCFLRFPYYTSSVDPEARRMNLWAKGILPLYMRQVKEGIDT